VFSGGYRAFGSGYGVFRSTYRGLEEVIPVFPSPNRPCQCSFPA